MNIYVASSWRNSYHPDVINELRGAGHNVFDYRHPMEDRQGWYEYDAGHPVHDSSRRAESEHRFFSWMDVDPNWEQLTAVQLRDCLDHNLSQEQFRRDYAALVWCDACVLVLPSGISAHIEAGWAAGHQKPVAIYAPEVHRAELMYRLFDVNNRTPLFSNLREVVSHLEQVA